MKNLKANDLKSGGAFIGVLLIVAVVQSLVISQVDTDCSLDNFAADAYNAWRAKAKLENLECYDAKLDEIGLLTESRKYARQLEGLLAKDHPRVGYKIGGHTPEALKMFRLEGPMWATFYGEDAFMQSYEALQIKEGQNFNFEPDFLLRVSGEGIMEAETAEEIGQYIDRVYAFIEFPDIFVNFETDGFISPYLMQAMNLGAAYGWIGEHLDAKDDPDFMKNLRNMTVVASGWDGTTRSTYHLNTESIHMFESLKYAIELMNERGESLKEGDLVSLGALMSMDAMGWGNPTGNSPGRHVHYYIGDQILHVAAQFKP